MKSEKETVFLTAHWKHLVMANYVVDPALLLPYVPNGTEPDTYLGKHFVSLVAFSFLHTKVRGIAYPFHRNFVEVNLRFYVRRISGSGERRGVVFIKEIVPRAMISFIANVFYNENYATMPTRLITTERDHTLGLHYSFGKYHHVEVECKNMPHGIPAGSMEAFITEHYWGYAGNAKSRTTEYRVEHPRWDVLPVNKYLITCDFGKLYGAAFTHLQHATPDSVLTATGSDVKVYSGRLI